MTSKSANFHEYSRLDLGNRWLYALSATFFMILPMCISVTLVLEIGCLSWNT